jgi:hypothetical protein
MRRNDMLRWCFFDGPQTPDENDRCPECKGSLAYRCHNEVTRTARGSDRGLDVEGSREELERRAELWEALDDAIDAMCGRR